VRLLLALVFLQVLARTSRSKPPELPAVHSGEVTAGQPLNLEAEVAQSFLREIDLPVFKGIFVAAAHQERELIAIRLEEVTEVKPIALRSVIGHEARSRSEVKQAIVAVHSAMELEDFGVGY